MFRYILIFTLAFASPSMAMMTVSDGTSCPSQSDFYAPLTADTSLTRGSGSATFSRASDKHCESTSGQLGKVTSGNACFDHADGLDIEGSRTNITNYSEDMGSDWTGATSVTTNVSPTSPEGATHGDDVYDGESNSIISHSNSSSTITSGAEITESFYQEKDPGYATSMIGIFTGGSGGSIHFRMRADTGDFVTPGGTGGVRSFDSNWWHVWGQRDDYNGDNTGIYNKYYPAWNPYADYADSWTQAPVGHSNIWGVQTEEGTFPSTYIETTGTSNVTRNADELTYPLSGNLTDNNVSGYMEVVWPYDHSSGTYYLWGSYSDGSNYTGLFYNGTSFVLRKMISSSSYDASVTVDISANTTYRVSWRISSKWGMKVCVNGSCGTHSNTTAAQLDATNFAIGFDENSSNYLYGRVRDFHLWEHPASNTQLIGVTRAICGL